MVGTIQGEQITSTDDMSVNDNLSVGGKILMGGETHIVGFKVGLLSLVVMVKKYLQHYMDKKLTMVQQFMTIVVISIPQLIHFTCYWMVFTNLMFQYIMGLIRHRVLVIIRF